MIGNGLPNPLLFSGGDPLDELAKVERSVRLRAIAGAYLSRGFSVPTQRARMTLFVLIKRSSLGSIQRIMTASDGGPSNDEDYGSFFFDSSDRLAYGGNTTNFRTTSMVFRDPAAFYPITLVFDTSNVVANNRIRMYVGLDEITSFSTLNNPAQNADLAFTGGYGHFIGATHPSPSNFFDGYVAYAAFVDGQALSPAAFGQIHPKTGQWRPKSKAAIRAAVAAGGGARNGWGTNGFFLPFDDTTSLTTLGYDRSQSDTDTTGNNWTATNISLTAGATYDSMLDTPTTNYATLNPLHKFVGGNLTISDGNLSAVHTAQSSQEQIVGTIAVKSAKWFWEVTVTNLSVDGYLGLIKASSNLQVNPANWLYWSVSGIQGYVSGVLNATGIATNDVLGFALDLDADTLGCYKGGSLVYTVTSLRSRMGISADDYVVPIFATGGTNGALSAVFNFGQRPFSNTPPTGFKTLCTKNLPFPKIPKSSAAIVSVMATGANIASTIAAARAGWPGYIDIIKRTDSGEGWRWIFSDDPTNYLDSAGTAAKAAVPAFSGTNYLGISLKVSAQNGVATGRLTHTNGVADVVTDGLGNTRKMVILKNEATGSWYVYHPDLTAGRLLYLESTSAENIDSSISSVTASGFTVAAALASGTYRWIAFADVEGAIKVGSYIGNSSADGPFDHRGHVPAFEINKTATNGSSSWFAFSNAFESNQETSILLPNSTSAVLTGYFRDSVSNGRKWRFGAGDPNTSGARNVYVSFAAFPFRYANAR